MKYVHVPILDPALGRGIFEGDLKYGRVSKTDNMHKDYPAERVGGTGEARNCPIAPLILQGGRDPKVWKRDVRLSKIPKTIKNSVDLVDELLLRSVQNPFGLASHLTKLKIGRVLSKSGG